jgi:hypothetical protein
LSVTAGDTFSLDARQRSGSTIEVNPFDNERTFLSVFALDPPGIVPEDLTAVPGTFSQSLTVSGIPVSLGGGGGGLQNIVEDTTPQLGGNLDAQSFDISSVTSLTSVTGTFTGGLSVTQDGPGPALIRVVSGDQEANVQIDSGATSAQIADVEYLDRGDPKWLLRKSSSNNFQVISLEPSVTAPITIASGAPTGSLDINRAGTVSLVELTAVTGTFSQSLTVSGIPVQLEGGASGSLTDINTTATGPSVTITGGGSVRTITEGNVITVSGLDPLVFVRRQTLNSDAATIEFTLPDTADYLHILMKLQTDRASSNLDNILCTFNNDSTAFYHGVFVGSNAAGSDTSGPDGATLNAGTIGLATATSSDSESFAVGEAWVYDYTNSSHHTAVSTLSIVSGDNTTTTNQIYRAGGFRFQKTVAVTSIQFKPNAGTNFIAGSEIVIYGYSKDEIDLVGPEIIANSGAFSDSLTISGVPVSTGTGPYYALYSFNAGETQSITNDTETTVLISAEKANTGGFSLDTGVITVPAGQGYTSVRFDAQVSVESNGTGYRQLRLLHNGNPFVKNPAGIIVASPFLRVPPASSVSSMLQLSTPLLTVSGGDQFEFTIRHTGGVALDVIGGGAAGTSGTLTYLMVEGFKG